MPFIIQMNSNSESVVYIVLYSVLILTSLILIFGAFMIYRALRKIEAVQNKIFEESELPPYTTKEYYPPGYYAPKSTPNSYFSPINEKSSQRTYADHNYFPEKQVSRSKSHHSEFNGHISDTQDEDHTNKHSFDSRTMNLRQSDSVVKRSNSLDAEISPASEYQILLSDQNSNDKTLSEVKLNQDPVLKVGEKMDNNQNYY